MNIETILQHSLSIIKNSKLWFVVLFILFAISISSIALPYYIDQGIGYVTKLLSNDFDRLYERTQPQNKGEWYLNSPNLSLRLKFFIF